MPPSDSNGNYTPVPSYKVVNGDTVLPVQYVPVVEDIANGLTNRLMKDGRTVMTGNLQMGSNRITGAAPGQADSDVATVGQAGRKASFKTVAALLADTTLSYSTGPARVSEGDIIEAQGFRYEVAASDATDAHLETAGGVKLDLAESTLSPEMLGASGGAFYAQDAEITASSTTFVSASANFTPDDVGKVIAIQRAGATGPDTRPMHLVTTIAAYVDANTVTLANPAGNTVDSGDDDHWRSWGYGTDETEAWQKLIEIGRPIKCRDPKSYFVTAPLGTLTRSVDLAGSTIIGCYADNDVVAGTESIFYVDGAPDVTVENGKGRWLGYFKKSYVSFVRATAPNFKTRSLEASGFSGVGCWLGSTGNPAGVYVATDNEVFDCHFHHNRVAGLLFGNTKDLKYVACRFHFNGLEGDGGTGYGATANSTCYPLDTLALGNHCNDNYRKGIDFHSGVGISVIGNFCRRNKIMGIYAEDASITGAVLIKGNIIGQMVWNGTIASGVAGEGSAPTMYGIMVGSRSGQGTGADPTLITVSDNTIEDFTMTAEGAYPLYYYGHGLSYGTIKFLNNTVKAGNVSALIGSNPGAGTAGNWFDITVQGGSYEADDCSLIVGQIRGTNNRKKMWSGTVFSVGTCANNTWAITYDSTSITDHTLIASGNIVNFPTNAMSSDWIRAPLDANKIGNVVNGTVVP